MREGSVFVNYDNMTREELIACIEEMKEKRAFTYEDRMKLIILDNSPFTVWASDRNCIIKLWMGQCESLYGFSSKEVIGKNFVDLFVAEDEKVAARRDQIEIIDSDAVFHNIANDIGKNGNTLQLVTNCCRVKDPISGEYWNAEMGLIIDFLEQEKDRLKLIVSESQKIKSCVTQFIEDTKQVKERFFNRRSSINTAIRECEQKATALRRRMEFKKNISNIRANLVKLSQKMDNVHDTYILKMQSCASFDICDEIRQSFFKEYEMISESLEDMALDVFDISCNYDVEQNIVSDKDALMKDIASQFRLLFEVCHTIIRKIEKEISDYKNQVTPNPNLESGPFKKFIDIKQDTFKLKDEIEKYEDELSIQMLSISSRLKLQTIKQQSEIKLNLFRQQLAKIEHTLNGE
jgi:PAS domain S-box-containing protein